MGVLDVLRGRDPVVSASVQLAQEPEVVQIETFASDLEIVEITPEVFGLASYGSTIVPASRVSRRDAIQCAAIKRSRDLIAGSLGTLPLTAVRPDLTTDTTSWLTQPEADVPRSVTMAKTVEDLVFEGPRPGA